MVAIREITSLCVLRIMKDDISFFYAAVPISSGTTPCQVFNSLNTCPSGQECAEDNGVVQCRLSFFSVLA